MASELVKAKCFGGSGVSSIVLVSSNTVQYRVSCKRL